MSFQWVYYLVLIHFIKNILQIKVVLVALLDLSIIHWSVS